MTTNTPNTCQKCGKPIMDGSPRGLCPMCLISAVAKTDGPTATDAPSPELDDLRGIFPQLEILEPLGAGGMGRVYKVRQPNLDRIVALKLLPPAYAADPEWVERFTREARALARLNHPNIVQVYDFGETAPDAKGERFPFLLMEYVDGVNLRQALRTSALTAREALTIVPSVCSALQYAHDQGVLHRDIKPENILLDTQGRVKIADFGLAKLHGDSAPGLKLTGTGAQLGTAAYMAPEQIEKPHDVDHRADIYSLGVVFYELLTGELPLGRFAPPSEKSGTDPRLDTIVFRTLEKERDRRYQSATDMRTEVENVASHPAPEPPISSPPAAPAPARNPWPRRIFLLLLALIVLPALLIVVGLIVPYFAARSPRALLGHSPAADVVRAERAPFVGRLPEGTVELVAVSHHPSAGEAWWKMDGTPASEGPFLNKGASANASIGERGYEFVFRMTNLPPSATLTTWQVKNSYGWATGDAPELATAPGKPLTGYQAIAATLPATLGATDIRIGFGFGEWETVFDSGSSGPGSTSPRHQGVMWKLGWSAPLETKDGETVSNWSVSRDPDWETRVVAVKNDGSEVTTANRSSANDQTTWRFSGLPVAQVKTFHFQVRRVQWVEFRGIELAPATP